MPLLVLPKLTILLGEPTINVDHVSQKIAMRNYQDMDILISAPSLGATNTEVLPFTRVRIL